MARDQRRIEEPREVEEHPRGALTLAILFAVLLVVIWFAVYFGIFIPRE